QRRQHRAGGIRFERLVVRQLQYSSGAVFHDPKLCRGRLIVDAVESEPQYPRLGGFAHKAGVEPRERLRLLPASGIDMLERIDAAVEAVRSGNDREAGAVVALAPAQFAPNRLAQRAGALREVAGPAHPADWLMPVAEMVEAQHDEARRAGAGYAGRKVRPIRGKRVEPSGGPAAAVLPERRENPGPGGVIQRGMQQWSIAAGIRSSQAVERRP